MGTRHSISAFCCHGADETEGAAMRGLLLWLIGIPLPIILLLYLFGYL